MKQEMLRVGFIGYGTIGQAVARIVAEQAFDGITLVGALVRHPTLAHLSEGVKIVDTLAALLELQPDVIVEAAGHNGLQEHGATILRMGIDLILISVGALADPLFFQVLLKAAQSGNAQMKVASGAIGALDALSSASYGRLTRVIHTLRKPPSALLRSEEAAQLTTSREIFRGNARQAVQQFPEFLNVAAAVALAGKGFDETEVCVLADPAIGHSVHEILAEGEFGIFRFEIENTPNSVPARGAKLVAMSIVHALLLRRGFFLLG